MTEISDKQLESIRSGAAMGKRLGMNDTLKLIATIRTQSAEIERLRSELEAERAWKPIADAPRDGRKMILYRPLAHLSHDPGQHPNEYPATFPKIIPPLRIIVLACSANARNVALSTTEDIMKNKGHIEKVDHGYGTEYAAYNCTREEYYSNGGAWVGTYRTKREAREALKASA